VLLVAGDQRRVGLGGEVVRKVKGTASQGLPLISSGQNVVTLDPNFRPHEAGGYLIQMELRESTSTPEKTSDRPGSRVDALTSYVRCV
jgi:hypothetical protein